MRQRAPRNGKTLRDRFEEKYIPEPNSGCWLWVGATNGGRYGKITAHDPPRTSLLAHRVAYELYRGPIPAGMLVCHKCDNIICVNPDHLFLGDTSDNARDAVAKGRGHFHWRRNPKTALSPEIVANIRRLTAAGERPKDLAARYGVTPETIYSVINHQTWKAA